MRDIAHSKSIEVSNLSMAFTSDDGTTVQALSPTTLQILPGEFVAVVGPSGCGKSTLLNILAGFLTPSEGVAKIGDEPVTGPTIDHGVVFQDYALFPWLTVLENVAFGLKNQGIGKAERDDIAAHFLDVVSLKDFAGKRPRELSGGMKQRAAIARTFATDPSVILMDEPFGALDALTRRFLQQQLLKIWSESRKTVLFITHSVQEAVFLADRIIVMTARPGRIKSDFRVHMAHPREFSSDEFRRIEKLVFESLDEELAKTFGLGTSQLQAD